MTGRMPFAYVVAVENGAVRLNLLDVHRGHIATHAQGLSPVGEFGALFGVAGGTRLFVLRVRALSFVEPREAHRAGVGTTNVSGEPLRVVEGVMLGVISRSGGRISFSPDSTSCPALGAEAFPLAPDELSTLIQASASTMTLELGREARSGVGVIVDVGAMLGRHVAVLGGTGQGKSCFTAAALQQLAAHPRARIVVFDVNGEYADALRPHAGAAFKETVLGGPSPTLKIPYYALGRHGLSRLLLPSERTQRPALAFALENLSRVIWDPAKNGAGLTAGDPVFFDDGRPGAADKTLRALQTLRRTPPPPQLQWPPMLALAALIADSHAVRAKSGGTAERDNFVYGNVSPLITRIHRFVEDPRFTEVVDVSGGAGTNMPLSYDAEGRALVARIFGSADATNDWRVHIINLREVAHDLMPTVLGALLELLAAELFVRGQAGAFPTLLVLEEAHHYLRQIADGDDPTRNALAYERLAKEGRKFGLSLWISTQRPSEVSPTVLAQCGTWIVFRLTAEHDLKAVSAAGEWLDRQDLARISGLPRQHALIFGASMPTPVRTISRVADPRPRSDDPDFSKWL